MSATAPLQRLDRLENYLREDPQNAALLADAFDTALQSGALDRAEFHLRHAMALGHDGPDWGLREAHLMLAQHRWDDARASLAKLRDECESEPLLAAAVAHDLAYVELRTGNAEAGLTALRPLVEGVSSTEPLAPSLQALWLRLLHREQRLADACRWAGERFAANQLAPDAAGVASLAALDAGDFLTCQRWADFALGNGGLCTEAFVARGSTALAQRDSARARTLTLRALEQNGEDGRTWSALGFCEMLDGQLAAARVAFDRAVVTMPDHIGTWHGMGWAALMANDLPAARRAFESALALDRNFGESHGGMAVVLAMAGEREAAQKAIERALRLDPGSLSPRYARAALDGDARDLGALQRLAHKVLGARPAPFGGNMADVVSSAAQSSAKDQEFGH